MKRSILTFFLVIVSTLAGAFSASAQTKALLGYCEGQIADATHGRVTGISGDEAWLDLAIRLPQSMLSSYAGCNITGINFGLPQADGYPEFATGWVRTSQSGANVVEGTNTALKKGWNAVSATKPYTITGQETELWIGVTFRQAMKMNIISFAGTDSPDGSWVGKNGKWTDYSSKHWGSLALEAIIEGKVPTRNLTIVTAQPTQTLVETGKPIVITGTIKNQAPETATRPIIRYDVNDGAVTGAYEVPATLAFRDVTDFSLSIPSDNLAPDATARITLTLCWPDGGEDDGPEDNEVQLTVDMVRELFYRTMLVEEGTGAWCGWCVYGIVGLREMKKLYGDRFIGIAVHDGDQYVVGNYHNWLVPQLPSGFPGCLINRSGGEQLPRFDELNNFYAHMDPIAEAGIDLTARYVDGKLVCEAESRFFTNHTNSDYRVVFVVTENQLPIHQKNYYAGNARGPMGGFENMPGDVDIEVDDIARAIYPSPTGDKGSIPAKVEKGVGYGYRITATMPKYNKAENLEVVAILLNGKTGEAIQATKTNKIYGLNAEEDLDGVAVPFAPGFTPDDVIYDLSGRRLAEPVPGQPYIKNGHKYVK